MPGYFCVHVAFRNPPLWDHTKGTPGHASPPGVSWGNSCGLYATWPCRCAARSPRAPSFRHEMTSTNHVRVYGHIHPPAAVARGERAFRRRGFRRPVDDARGMRLATRPRIKRARSCACAAAGYMHAVHGSWITAGALRTCYKHAAPNTLQAVSVRTARSAAHV